MMTSVRNRFDALMRAKLTKRALTAVCVGWLVFMLAPLFALSAYMYPTHDDFPNAMLTLDAWMRTGSVLEVVGAAWRQAVADYYQWQGTFAAMFLCALQPMVFSMDLMWLSPAVTIALLCLSAAFLCRQIARHILRSDGTAALVLSTALITLLVFSAPGVSELFYWHAALQYTFSVIVMQFLAGLLIKLHWAQLKKGIYAAYTVLAGVLSVLLGGLPYTHALGGAVAIALVALWCVKNRSKATAAAAVSFVCVLASLIIVIIAPGNALRQSAVGESMPPVLAVACSLKDGLCCAADWFGWDWLGVSLVVVPVLWPLLARSGADFRNPVWFSLFSFGVLAACFVPPIFATGADSWHLPRIEGSLYMLWSLIGFLNLVYWLGWAAKRFERFRVGQLSAGCAIACAVLVFAGAFAQHAPFATPVPGAWKSVLSGEAAAYRAEIMQRQDKIVAARTKDEIVEAIQPLNTQPSLLPLDELIYQRRGKIPRYMQVLVKAQDLVREYGRGNVPEEAWQELKRSCGIE